MNATDHLRGRRLATLFAAAALMVACDQADGPVGAVADPGLPAFFDCIRESDTALISAHRAGASWALPENAVQSLDAVLEIGPAMVEVDVRTTRDGVLILLHDRTLNRTTTGSGPVASKAYEELGDFRLLDTIGTVTPFRIPTLREALLATKERGILSIDLKDVQLSALVREIRRADAMGWVSLIAYDLEDAVRIRQAAPEAMIALTVNSAADLAAAQRVLGDLNLITAWTGLGDPRPRLYRQLEEAGIEVTLGTFRTVDRQPRQRAGDAYRALQESGVDIIATNNARDAMQAIPPDQVRACLRGT